VYRDLQKVFDEKRREKRKMVEMLIEKSGGE